MQSADVYLGAPVGPWTGPVPVADRDSAAFWDGLRRHRLLILRCVSCRYWLHPPQASCHRCFGMRLEPEEVSGRGTVYSYTLAQREFAPGVKPPYVAALVELEEQEGLRLVTNIVNIRAADVRIGLPVQVLFWDLDDADVTLALFEPRRPDGGR